MDNSYNLLYILIIVVVLIHCYESSNTRIKVEPFKNININANTPTSKDYRFELVLVDTPKKMETGLMYRSKPLYERQHIIQGMLFDYKKMGKRSMWMKNTIIPLDMIFMDNNMRVVGIIKNAEPYSTTSRTIENVARYVLELNGNTSSRLGLSIGDTISSDKITLINELVN
jgi:uncharacterized membrane protein (UPF0127 family)